MSGQLLQHLGGTGKPISRLSHANVEAQFHDAQLAHGVVLGLILGSLENKVINNVGVIAVKVRLELETECHQSLRLDCLELQDEKSGRGMSCI